MLLVLIIITLPCLNVGGRSWRLPNNFPLHATTRTVVIWNWAIVFVWYKIVSRCGLSTGHRGSVKELFLCSIKTWTISYLPGNHPWDAKYLSKEMHNKCSTDCRLMLLSSSLRLLSSAHPHALCTFSRCISAITTPLSRPKGNRLCRFCPHERKKKIWQ